MTDKIKLQSVDQKSIVTINQGELVSYQVDGLEIMHQKGDKGWGNTEIEMFPIIGATKANKFSVQTPKGDAKLDQHGILRVMTYVHEITKSNQVSYSKNYIANTPFTNPKFPEKSSQQWLDWPYDFEFIKTFELTEIGLKIVFEIKSEKAMPFMLGFHPAFKIYGKTPRLTTDNKSTLFDDVLRAGASAFLLNNSKEVLLENNGDLAISIKTDGFKHIMLWSEVTNMICIEPITFYPPSVSPDQLYKGFDYSSGYEKFEVTISPFLS